MVNRTGRSGEMNACGAHATITPRGAGSCGTLLQLEEGDELYAKGHGGASASLCAGSAVRHSSLEAYLLQKATPSRHQTMVKLQFITVKFWQQKYLSCFCKNYNKKISLQFRFNKYLQPKSDFLLGDPRSTLA